MAPKDATPRVVRRNKTGFWCRGGLQVGSRLLDPRPSSFCDGVDVRSRRHTPFQCSGLLSAVCSNIFVCFLRYLFCCTSILSIPCPYCRDTLPFETSSSFSELEQYNLSASYRLAPVGRADLTKSLVSSALFPHLGCACITATGLF